MGCVLPLLGWCWFPPSAQKERRRKHHRPNGGRQAAPPSRGEEEKQYHPHLVVLLPPVCRVGVCVWCFSPSLLLGGGAITVGWCCFPSLAGSPRAQVLGPGIQGDNHKHIFKSVFSQVFLNIISISVLAISKCVQICRRYSKTFIQHVVLSVVSILVSNFLLHKIYSIFDLIGFGLFTFFNFFSFVNIFLFPFCCKTCFKRFFPLDINFHLQYYNCFQFFKTCF